MPGRRYPNLVRDCVFGVLLSGSVLGSLLYSNNRYEKVRSRAESLEQEVLMQHDSLDALASGVAGLGSAVETVNDYNFLLGLNVADLREKVASVGVDHSNALEATIQVLMKVNGAVVYTSSGTVIYGTETKSGRFTNYVLCAAHAIDDSEFLLPGKTAPAITYGVVDFRGINGSSEYESKFVLSHAGKDWALLSFESDFALPTVRIASNDKLASIDELSDVFAIGCSMGEGPILTEGRLQVPRIFLNDNLYWRVSAPSVVGNSGGGVYLSRDNELIGISTGVVFLSRPNGQIPVYHLAFMSPLVGFREWLDKNDLSFILNSGFGD